MPVLSEPRIGFPLSESQNLIFGGQLLFLVEEPTLLFRGVERHQISRPHQSYHDFQAAALTLSQVVESEAAFGESAHS